MVENQTCIDGFKNKFSISNDTYSVELSLDNNANVVIPTTLYANMLGINEVTDDSTAWIQNGMMYEDTDGKLKYKNRSGIIHELTN